MSSRKRTQPTEASISTHTAKKSKVDVTQSLDEEDIEAAANESKEQPGSPNPIEVVVDYNSATSTIPADTNVEIWTTSSDEKQKWVAFCYKVHIRESTSKFLKVALNQEEMQLQRSNQRKTSSPCHRLSTACIIKVPKDTFP